MSDDKTNTLILGIVAIFFGYLIYSSSKNQETLQPPQAYPQTLYHPPEILYQQPQQFNNSKDLIDTINNQNIQIKEMQNKINELFTYKQLENINNQIHNNSTNTQNKQSPDINLYASNLEDQEEYIHKKYNMH